MAVYETCEGYLRIICYFYNLLNTYHTAVTLVVVYEAIQGYLLIIFQ